MPPKKKDKKEKKKDKKKDGDAGLKEWPLEPPLNESSKQYYLIQIKDLETRLVRYQKKCDELSVLNNEVEEKYNQLVQDRKDIVDFLKKTLEERQEEISNLQDRLVGEQQMKCVEKEAFEEKIKLANQDFQDSLDKLTADLTILGGKLQSLEEFKEQKDVLMAKFADMEVKLDQQDKNHTKTLYDLEKKAILDKDRLKKEMVTRVNTVADEFRKMSNKQMAETVKRNIRENIAINNQLSKMTDTIKELVQENDELRRQDKENKIQIEVLEVMQGSLAKKNNSNEKILKIMSTKLQDHVSTIRELEGKEREYVLTAESSETLRSENEIMKQQIESMTEDMKYTRDRLNKALAEREQLTTQNTVLEDVISSTAYALTDVLVENSDEDKADKIHKRQSMIERLLLVLNSAAALKKGPPPCDMVIKKNKAIMAPLVMKGTKCTEKISILERYREFPHYRLGDLGLVPRPKVIDSKLAALSTNVSKTNRSGLKSQFTTTDPPSLSILPRRGSSKLPRMRRPTPSS